MGRGSKERDKREKGREGWETTPQLKFLATPQVSQLLSLIISLIHHANK